MKRMICAAALILDPAIAAASETYEISTSLGTILACEAHCGFAFDADAVAGYVADAVPAGAMGFAAELQGMVMVNTISLQGQSGAARVAHCAAVAQTARHYGFME